jgi:RNA polymerase sigma-70 factor (ECF subfamily)
MARHQREAGGEDLEMLERLRAGDEAAFVALVGRYHETMVRIASSFVPTRAVAEEVVQDTWLGVVRGIERFEGRSSLRTWLFRILVNRARTAGVKERRSMAAGAGGPTVDPSRFDGAGVWSLPPPHWDEDVAERLAAGELSGTIRQALAGLPGLQREVVALRDIDGLTGREVCDVLDISEGHQRVLLHRARSGLRQALETQLGRA